MARYRKKPVVIEAEQFFAANKPWPRGVYHEIVGKRYVFHVVTIHGQKTYVVDADWIIPEPDGEHHYPCKPDIFDKTYEKETSK